MGNAVPSDLIGYKTGYLTVLAFEKRDEKSRQYWKCQCAACGKTKVMSRRYLLSGQAKSCGCRNGRKYNLNGTPKIFNTYDLSGDYGIGYTSKNQEFYFDLEDYDKIKNYSWHISDDGYVKSGGRNKLSMHRLVLDIQDQSQYVDHIHHNKNDNRKSELRVVTSSQNQMNSVARKNSSGIRGVSWHKTRKAWIAQIQINGKLKYLGIFKNLEDAANARKEAEIQYFGDYMFNAI